MNFLQFGLPDQIIKALTSMNFIKPSLIQEKSIPAILNQEDVICQGEAGTGKTLCFLTRVLHLGLQAYEQAMQKSYKSQKDDAIQNFNNPLPYAMIIVPTRELAIQITDILSKLIKYIDAEYHDYLLPHLFIGGLPVEQDRDILKTRRCTIIIGTVGRIMQMIQEKIMSLCNIKLLILDEADKLHENFTFQSHFKKILFNIVGLDGNKPQIICFSATYPTKIMGLIQLQLKNPKFIKSNEQLCLDNLLQCYIKLDYQDENKSKYQIKTQAIIDILKILNVKQTIIFYNDKIRGENLFTDLKAEGYIPVLIHGDHSQSDRIKLVNYMKRNKTNLIISTDLLSRGIDIETLDLVIHFDTPTSYETYLHRIGRTGRFGTFGLTILLEDTNFSDILPLNLQNIEQLNKKFDDKHSNQILKKEYYAEFLSGISDWKQSSYQFYNEEKFKYYDDQEQINEKNQEEIFIKPQKKIKIQDQQQINNQEHQITQQIQQTNIINNNNLINIEKQEFFEEMKEIFNCKCCSEFYKQLKNFSNELEIYFK